MITEETIKSGLFNIAEEAGCNTCDICGWYAQVYDIFTDDTENADGCICGDCLNVLLYGEDFTGSTIEYNTD